MSEPAPSYEIHDNVSPCQHRVVEYTGRRLNRWGDKEFRHWECVQCHAEFSPHQDLMAQAETFRTPLHRLAHATVNLWSTRCDRYGRLHPDAVPSSPESMQASVDILVEAIVDIFAPHIAEVVHAAINRETPLGDSIKKAERR